MIISRKNISLLAKSILAGIMISLGSFAYVVCMSMQNKIVGSALFSIGLLLICFLSLMLYTGKIGFIIDSTKEDIKSNLLNLVIIYIGNFIGAIGTGALCYLIFSNSSTQYARDILTAVNNIAVAKEFNSNNLSFILSFFCGILVFLAVYLNKRLNNEAARFLFIFLCVFIFVISGFDHCIANMFYFSCAGVWSVNAFLNILLVTIGNSSGSIFLNGMLKI